MPLRERCLAVLVLNPEFFRSLNQQTRIPPSVVSDFFVYARQNRLPLSTLHLSLLRSLPKLSTLCLECVVDVEPGLWECLVPVCQNLLDLSLTACPVPLSVLRRMYAHLRPAGLDTSTCLQVLKLSAMNIGTDEDLDLLCRNWGRSLKKIDLSKCQSVSGAGYAHLSNIPSLEAVNLRATKLNDRTLCNLLRDLSRLRVLYASACPALTLSLPLTVFTAEALQLEMLVINSCANAVLPLGIFEVIGRNLRTLELQSCPRALRDEHGPSLSSLPHLSTLRVSGSTLITDAFWTAFAAPQALAKVGCLDMSSCPLVSARALSALATSTALTELSSLEALFFAAERADPVNVPAITALLISTAASLRRLTLGKVSGFTNEVFEALPPRSPDHRIVLSEVSLANLFSLGSPGISALAQWVGSALTSISLRLVAIDGAALAALVEHCPNLESVSLVQCTMLSDDDVFHLARLRSPLKHLDLSGLPQVTDSGVVQLLCSGGDGMGTGDGAGTGANGHGVQVGPHLLSLGLNHLRLTNRAIYKIPQCCPKLRSLGLSGVFDLSDGPMQFLAQCCPNLESLVLSGTSVTDRTLSWLSEGCPRLREIFLENVPEISSKAVVQLQRRCPLLRQVHAANSGADGMAAQREMQQDQRRIQRNRDADRRLSRREKVTQS
eukprot:TRINITY_DN6961_c0_g1_i3.p1 TRINITY_DN6961_c0_g1~~TRINITY_DN6961_c0_g1_i3.p1  ORF type:complete len:673 (-),score=99.20 TRINITY_DN6961_c0_g1_i3:8-2005(-)